jgi:hypothetical protein
MLALVAPAAARAIGDADVAALRSGWQNTRCTRATWTATPGR